MSADDWFCLQVLPPRELLGTFFWPALVELSYVPGTTVNTGIDLLRQMHILLKEQNFLLQVPCICAIFFFWRLVNKYYLFETPNAWFSILGKHSELHGKDTYLKHVICQFRLVHKPFCGLTSTGSGVPQPSALSALPCEATMIDGHISTTPHSRHSLSLNASSF